MNWKGTGRRKIGQEKKIGLRVFKISDLGVGMAGEQPGAVFGSNFVSHSSAFSHGNPFLIATSAVHVAQSAQTMNQSQV